MKKRDLLPCPFCGSEAEMLHNVGKYAFAVACTKEMCAGNAPLLRYDSEEEAAEAWNTRQEHIF